MSERLPWAERTPRSYRSMHDIVRHVRGQASDQICVDCHGPASEWSYRGDCPDERVTGSVPFPWCPHVADYEPRCKPCHYVHDERFLTVMARGENHHNAKLTEAIVRDARRRHAAGAFLPELAVEYGVKYGTLWLAVTGRSWKHVT